MSRKYHLIISIPMLLALTSCAWMSRQMKEEEEPEMVPRAQYDALMTKFTELEKKVATQAPAATPKADDLVSELEKTAMKDNESMEAKSTLMETVDVFDAKGTSVVTTSLPGKSGEMSETNMSNSGVSNIESEITELKKAMGMAGAGKFDQATKMLQSLSKSSNNKQVQVRAKFGTGEVFLAQKEYDLALQVYEDIINHNVYSGLVLNALKRAITCSEKLNLTDKKARYESLLKDVFGT
ncbi:MAG: tetratricopeptide repeat protein [Bacteriovoracaceae bacterium]